MCVVDISEVLRVIRGESYANSLSMLSPKPGVSTMVKAMRTPSSSSSACDICHGDVWGTAGGNHVPTLTGLILIPSSTCAVSGLSQTLCCRTSDSHRVFTNVVRPVPEAPEG